MNQKQDMYSVFSTAIKSICSSFDVSKETMCQQWKELADEYDIRPADYLSPPDVLNGFQKNLTEFRFKTREMLERTEAVISLLQGNSASTVVSSLSTENKKETARSQKSLKQKVSNTVPKKRGRKPKNHRPDGIRRRQTESFKRGCCPLCLRRRVMFKIPIYAVLHKASYLGIFIL